jgi:predicted dehydrogenase
MAGVLNVGLVGLGVMGQRMLERLRGHGRLKATMVWDANPDIVARTVELHPELRSAETAEQMIGRPGLHSLYIATPPAAHIRLSDVAFDAGLAVLCEKPLTVDFAAAHRIIRRIEKEQCRAAVNFSLASSKGLAILLKAFGPDSPRPLGDLLRVDIDLAFSAWPRPWQMAAGPWLSERVEGGFAREVLSHFVFVLQRVLGPAAVWGGHVVFPADGLGAETALQADLRVDEVSVHVTGRVDAAIASPDRNRMAWRAQNGVITLRDWFGVTSQRTGQAEQWLVDADTARAAGQTDQLDQWVAMIEGREHLLPGFDEALAVQQTIEAILHSG